MSELTQTVRRQTLNRFFHRAGKWYVEAREGCQGPFFRREEAVAHLEKHIRRHGWKRDRLPAAVSVQIPPSPG